MPVVKYTARRSLVSGYSDGAEVTFDLPARYAGMPRSRQAFGHRRMSLSGQREAYYYRGETSYGVATYPLEAAKIADMRMFLDSVEEGQVFLFAPNDTSATPSPDWRNAVVEDGKYDEAVTQERQDLISFAFRVTEVP